jgi:hypothetical protein
MHGCLPAITRGARRVQTAVTGTTWLMIYLCQLNVYRSSSPYEAAKTAPAAAANLRYAVR